MGAYFTAIQSAYPYRIFSNDGIEQDICLCKSLRNEHAIKEAEKLNLNENNYYHSLLGYLYADTDIDKAIAHYSKAINLTKSKSEKKTLMKEIERLTTASTWTGNSAALHCQPVVRSVNDVK